MHRLVTPFLVLVMVATVSVAGTGAVVFFKNGTHIRARETLKIDGRNALITLVTGTVASYPLDQVDLVRTERYNKLGYGDAFVIDEGELDMPRTMPTPTPSLGGLGVLDMSTNPVLGSTVPPTPTPTPGIRLQSARYHDPRVDQAFSQIFDDRKLYSYRTSVGTQPEYYFVHAVTDDQREVFHAIKVVTEAYSIIHELHPDVAPITVELEMVSIAGRPAGTFRITPEMARSLATGEMSVEQFYVGYVIF